MPPFYVPLEGGHNKTFIENIFPYLLYFTRYFDAKVKMKHPVYIYYRLSIISKKVTEERRKKFQKNVIETIRDRRRMEKKN